VLHYFPSDYLEVIRENTDFNLLELLKIVVCPGLLLTFPLSGTPLAAASAAAGG
jgi:hypothetical protein